MANKYERPFFFGNGEQFMQFEIHLRIRSWKWAGVAPGIAGSIVRADARKFADGVLHKNPVGGDVADADFDHDRRRTLAGAMQMHFMASDVEELPRRTWNGRIGLRGYCERENSYEKE